MASLDCLGRYPRESQSCANVVSVNSLTIAHKKITEPNFIIFELFSVIPALWLPNRFVSGINSSR